MIRGNSVGRGYPYGIEQDNRNPGFDINSPPGPAPENISGISKKKYRVITLDLTNARDRAQFDVDGTLIQAVKGYDNSLSAPDANVEIAIRFNEIAADAVPFFPGQAIGGLPFNKIFVTNAAQTDKEITLLFIVDSPLDRTDVE